MVRTLTDRYGRFNPLIRNEQFTYGHLPSANNQSTAQRLSQLENNQTSVLDFGSGYPAEGAVRQVEDLPNPEVTLIGRWIHKINYGAEDTINYVLRDSEGNPKIVALNVKDAGVMRPVLSEQAALPFMPTAIDVDSAGNIWTLDTLNHRLKKITSSGVLVGDLGLTLVDWTDGSAFGLTSGTRPPFVQPGQVAINSSGVMFVADFTGGVLRTLDANGAQTATTTLAQCTGVTVDTSGNIYVGFWTGTYYEVRKYNSSMVLQWTSTVLSSSAWNFLTMYPDQSLVYATRAHTASGNQLVYFNATTGAATGAGMASGTGDHQAVTPRGLAFGPDKDNITAIHIVDSGNGRVLVWGAGTGLSRRSWPVPVNSKGIAYRSSDQKYYVADYNGNLILRYSKSGVFETSFPCFSPYGIAFNAAETTMIVTDLDEKLIRKFTYNASTGGFDETTAPWVVGITVSMATHPDGNVFILSDVDNYVQSVNPNGAVDYTNALSATTWRAVAFDSLGYAYLASYTGTNISLTKTDITDVPPTVVASNAATAGYPGSIATDGTWVWVADLNNDLVKKFSASTLAFDSNIGSAGTGDGQYSNPIGIVYTNGTLFVLDGGNNRVQKLVAATGAFITKWTVAAGSFGIAVDNDGNIWVPEETTDLLKKYDQNGNLLHSQAYTDPGYITFDGDNNMWLSKSTSGSPIQRYIPPIGDTSGSGNGEFNTPRSVAVRLSDNRVYVADTENNRIQYTTSTPTYTGKWGTFGTGNGQFNSPQGLVFNQSTSKIFVSDTDNHRIQRFADDGTYETQWGAYGFGEADLNTPKGLALDSLGNVIVANTGNNRISKFTANGTYLGSFGSTGNAPGQLNVPVDVWVDASDNIWVVEEGNDRIQIFSETFAFQGMVGSSGSAEGNLFNPSGMWLDNINSVGYVADTGNSRISRLFSPDPEFIVATDNLTVGDILIWNGSAFVNEPSAITDVGTPDAVDTVRILDSFTVTNMAAAEVGDGTIGFVYDMTGVTEIAMSTEVTTPANSGARYYIKASQLVPSTFTHLGVSGAEIGVPINVAGKIHGSWLAVDPSWDGKKVMVAIYRAGGDGAADPVGLEVNVHFRRRVVGQTGADSTVPGPTGATGRIAPFTLNWLMNFSTSTTDADPGSGFIRLNNASPDLATQIYHDDTDADATGTTNRQAFINSGTSAVKGILRIESVANPGEYCTYKVVGFTDATGYWKLTVEWLQYSGTFSNNEPVYVSYLATGDKGEAGSGGTYTDELAQDAVGTILVDSSSINFTYTDATPAITATVIESGLTLSNIGGTVTDAQVPNTITLDNITQITTRSHTSLADIGTNTHATIDSHLSNASNPHAVVKAQVGLGNVDNTSDADKPVSTAQQAALDLKQPLDTELTLLAGLAETTGNIIQSVAGAWASQTPAQVKTSLALVKADVGLGSVDNTADTAKPVSTAQQTALNLKANLASPTFTGTVAGITKSMVGLGSVDNTADTAKPVSTAQQTALDLKANLASPAFTGTPTGITKTHVGLANVDNTTDANKPVSTATQTALNLKANLASPTFTGTVAGITKAMVGLTNVDDTADTAKPVSTAQQTALNLKANLASPAFTGTPTGITKTHVGLSNVDNTADTAKPVSTAQQTALDLKANLSGATFTGDIIIPDEAYGVGWNASLEAATKNAIYDKIETLGGASLTDPTTTKGDLIARDASDIDRLPIGTDTYVLTADATETLGMKWAAPSSGGDVVLIGTYSFSSATEIIINNIFDSTYENYRLFVITDSSSAAGYLNMRYRVGGVEDATASSYADTLVVGGTYTAVGYRDVAATSLSGLVVDCLRPALVTPTGLVGVTYRLQVAPGVVAGVYNSIFKTAKAFDGIRVYPASGTFTGKVVVYGLVS